MYCEKCGRKLQEGTAECPYCNPMSSFDAGAIKHFSFSKTKGFSYVNYKDIDTEITIKDHSLIISEQTTWFAFWKRPVRTYSIPLNQISAIHEKRIWDLWDLVFAGGIVILSRIRSIIWLLLTLLFLYSSAGWRITIACKDGGIHKIQYSGLHPQSDFLNVLQGMLMEEVYNKQ